MLIFEERGQFYYSEKINKQNVIVAQKNPV